LLERISARPRALITNDVVTEDLVRMLADIVPTSSRVCRKHLAVWVAASHVEQSTGVRIAIELRPLHVAMVMRFSILVQLSSQSVDSSKRYNSLNNLLRIEFVGTVRVCE